MAPVVVVHGILNYAKGAKPAEAAERGAERWRDRLDQGLHAQPRTGEALFDRTRADTSTAAGNPAADGSG
ncbi:hypothetical protein AB0L75_24770 [Streptomyces sp. NPDC052101]|uniref:hypothetical protein n=1 Tax=Streptomyces sp. NPDC052101 TaxID=3155763 RepID=UPI00343993F0